MNPERYEFNGRLLPEQVHYGLTNYLVHHVPAGSFLTAVLENDLKEACARADDDCMWALPVIVAYLYNEAPSQAWGSKESVRDWLKMRGTSEAKKLDKLLQNAKDK
jgi:hypothetical protein